MSGLVVFSWILLLETGVWLDESLQSEKNWNTIQIYLHVVRRWKCTSEYFSRKKIPQYNLELVDATWCVSPCSRVPNVNLASIPRICFPSRRDIWDILDGAPYRGATAYLGCIHGLVKSFAPTKFNMETKHAGLENVSDSNLAVLGHLWWISWGFFLNVQEADGKKLEMLEKVLAFHFWGSMFAIGWIAICHKDPSLKGDLWWQVNQCH